MTTDQQVRLLMSLIKSGLSLPAAAAKAGMSERTARNCSPTSESRSLSCPQVTDDNPFSEAQFKTLKYQPGFPGRFQNITAAITIEP